MPLSIIKYHVLTHVNVDIGGSDIDFEGTKFSDINVFGRRTFRLEVSY